MATIALARKWCRGCNRHRVHERVSGRGSRTSLLRRLLAALVVRFRCRECGRKN